MGLGPSYYPASLLSSPGPRPSPVFRSALCDCLSLNVPVSLSLYKNAMLGAALALPPPAAPLAPVVQAVAVSAGVGSYAGVLGGGA